MEEKDFMKRVSEVNMTDVLEVKKSCMKQLNKDDRDRYIHIHFLKVAVVAMIIVCLCILPVNSLAKNIVQHIKTLLNLNGKSVELGNIDKTNIEIPDDCEEVKDDGIIYLSKDYSTLPDLMKDIQTDIYIWTGTDEFFDDGIMLNIVQNDYGRITLLYDLTKNNVIDKNSDTSDLQSVGMFVYFPLSEKTTLGNIMLQNEQLKYGTIDEEGNIEKYQQNTEYELVEQYENTDLDTTITVISSISDTKGSGDLGELTESDTVYYLYFTLEGMCYQINCVGTLDKAHDVIKNVKKTNIADSISNASTNSESGSNDLLYRTADGASVTLEQGEEINISVMDGKEYDDVYISLVGKNVIQKIGSLNANTPYSYSAAASGEYVIYAGKNQTNIIEEVVIEHSCSNGDDLYPLD